MCGGFFWIVTRAQHGICWGIRVTIFLSAHDNSHIILLKKDGNAALHKNLYPHFSFAVCGNCDNPVVLRCSLPSVKSWVPFVGLTYCGMYFKTTGLRHQWFISHKTQGLSQNCSPCERKRNEVQPCMSNWPLPAYPTVKVAFFKSNKSFMLCYMTFIRVHPYLDEYF